MKKIKKKKNLNKSIFCILTVFVLLFALAIPCFAWANIPISSSPDTYSFAYRSNSVNTYTVYAWSYDGITYAVMTDDRYFNILSEDWTDFNIYVPVGASAPTESKAEEIVNKYLNSVKEGTNGQNYNSAYSNGYNKGLEEADIAENTLLTLFSAPTYILSTVFNFEIFGINVYAIVCFVLTLGVVAFILKRVL